jgi:hypothetical protein
MVFFKLKRGYNINMLKLSFGPEDAGRILATHKIKPGKKWSYTHGVIRSPVKVDINNPEHASALQHEAMEHRYRKDLQHYDRRYKSLMSARRKLKRLGIKADRPLSSVLRLGETPRTVRAGFSQHNSPRVLLAEHNAIKSNPDFADPMILMDRRVQIKHPWSPRFRSEAGVLEKHIPGFKFGQSPRLSRHAMKRVMDILSKRKAMIL